MAESTSSESNSPQNYKDEKESEESEESSESGEDDDSSDSDETVENDRSEGDSNLVHSTSSELLQERIESLRNSMTILRNQLKEERELWKKEVDEAIKMSNTVQNQEVALESSSSAGLTSMSSVDLNKGIDCMKEFTIAEYEHKLQEYKAALAKAEAEKRATLQRQMAISNYKRRLLEVENMCNIELLKVKQNIQFLQPLQMITAEWNLGGNNSSNEISRPEEDLPRIEGSKAAGDAPPIGDAISDKMEQRVLPAHIEMFTNKFYNDMNDMFTKLTPSVMNTGLHGSIPHLATTSVQFKTDDFMAHSQSTVWYASEPLPITKF